MTVRAAASGAILIEVVVASGILVAGLLVLYLAFLQDIRTTERNQSNSVAINILSTVVDADAQIAQPNTLSNTPANQPQDISSEAPDLSLLPSATLTRAVSQPSDLTDGNTKILDYTLSWNGTQGAQTLKAEYEITTNGLGNP